MKFLLQCDQPLRSQVNILQQNPSSTQKYVKMDTLSSFNVGVFLKNRILTVPMNIHISEVSHNL